MTSPTSTTAVQLTLVGAADAVTAAELRRALKRWLQKDARASAEVRDNIVLGVNEALANCVEHAYHAHHTAGTMRLQASYDPAAQSISVCVSDRGAWQQPSLKHPNDPYASRGIMLMHALSDHCTIIARPNGTTVCLDYSSRPEASDRRQHPAHGQSSSNRPTHLGQIGQRCHGTHDRSSMTAPQSPVTTLPTASGGGQRRKP